MSLEKSLYNKLHQNQLVYERNKNKILPYGGETRTEQEVNYDEIDEKLYYNLTIFNPATTFDNKFNTQTLTADFDINRVDEIVSVPSEWQVAIQSFNIPNNIPIIVQRKKNGVVIPEDNIYKIVLYNRSINKGKYGSVDFGTNDITLPVGAVYDYERIILILNNALLLLTNALYGSSINPYTNTGNVFGVFFSRNNDTQRLECWIPYFNYNAGDKMELYFSSPLKDLLSGFFYVKASENVLPLPSPQTLDEGFYRFRPYSNSSNPLKSLFFLPLLITASEIDPLGNLYNGTYTNVNVSGGTGSGALIQIVIESNFVTSIIFTNNGDRKYVTGDVVTISGSDIGGTTPNDDIQLTLFITDLNYKGWLVMVEQWDCRPPASQFDKLIFRTSTIPVKNELIGEQKDILSRQLLDYSLQARINNGFQILYQPEVLKWSDMNSNSDLRRISLNVVLQRNGILPRNNPTDPIQLEEFPLYIQPNKYFNVKLVFRRKQVYNMRSV